MLSREMLQEELQKHDFDQLACQELNGWRIRLLTLAHLKEGRTHVETAQALRTTRHAVKRWMQWFALGGMKRLSGVPHAWRTQRLSHAQQKAFRQAVARLQVERGGGRVHGEDIRQLLDEQFELGRVFRIPTTLSSRQLLLCDPGSVMLRRAAVA